MFNVGDPSSEELNKCATRAAVMIVQLTELVSVAALGAESAGVAAETESSLLESVIRNFERLKGLN